MARESRERLIERSIEKWGIKAWLTITCEESAELTQAAAKFLRGRKKTKTLLDEIADVTIALMALRKIYGKEAEKRIKEKFKRLEKRVNSKKYKPIRPLY